MQSDPTKPMSDMLTFEQPLNEKCRLLLRIAHLFAQLDFHLPQAHRWHTRAALQALLEIANILARADIKPELIKELDLYRAVLARVEPGPQVNTQALQQVLTELQDAHTTLANQSGQLGEKLRKDDFLNSIYQRSAIPGGTSDFDLPQLHQWLQQEHTERLSWLQSWYDQVQIVHSTVDLLLRMIRHSTTFTRSQATRGFFQQNLDRDLKVQMIRIALPEDSELFAEISGGRHRFSVRFMHAESGQSAMQTDQDVAFRLNVCSVAL
jgi:cell division protein ZapD